MQSQRQTGRLNLRACSGWAGQRLDRTAGSGGRATRDYGLHAALRHIPPPLAPSPVPPSGGFRSAAAGTARCAPPAARRGPPLPPSPAAPCAAPPPAPAAPTPAGTSCCQRDAASPGRRSLGRARARGVCVVSEGGSQEGLVAAGSWVQSPRASKPACSCPVAPVSLSKSS